MTSTKPNIVLARLSTLTTRNSSYCDIEVCFSIVEHADGLSTPGFISWEYGMSNQFRALKNLKLTSYLRKEEAETHGQKAIEGFHLALDMTTPVFNAELETTVNVGKRLLNRMEKQFDSEGHPTLFSDYLSAVLRLLKVKNITFESYSEEHYNQKWKCFKIAEIPVLIEKAVEQCRHQN